MQQININLLPKKKKKLDVKLPSIPIFPIVMLLIIGGMAYYLFMIMPQGWDEELAVLDQQIQDLRARKNAKIGEKKNILKNLNDEIARLETTYNTLKKLTGVDKVPWSTILAELSTIMPEEVWIKSFNYDKSGKVTMSCVGVPVEKDGEKYEYGAVSSFLESIETKTSIFYQPFCSSASLSKMRGKPIVNFSMACKLKKEKTTGE